MVLIVFTKRCQYPGGCKETFKTNDIDRQFCDTHGGVEPGSPEPGPPSTKANEIIPEKPETTEGFFASPGGGKPSVIVDYGLDILKQDTISIFEAEFKKRSEQYHWPESDADAYLEVRFELTSMENLSKVLLRWDRYLCELPDCQHKRGASLVLQKLASLCRAIDNLKPTE